MHVIAPGFEAPLVVGLIGKYWGTICCSGIPLLFAPYLKRLEKFSDLIDLDFMRDLINHLKVLASDGRNSGNSSKKCPKFFIVTNISNVVLLLLK
ncbi:hypothetical protein HN51_022633 [Arachis hypogaea]